MTAEESWPWRLAADMTFPETRLTLIRRLSSGGSESDWSEFLDDYWNSIYGFARRWGGLSAQDAEDVAAETFQAIIGNRLLERWQEHRSARLRTLLCGVTRNVISNRARVAKGRRRILRELADRSKDEIPATIWTSVEPSAEQIDAFYRAWVNSLLERCVDRTLVQLHREGKGDYFRVLYGRVCEELHTPDIARMLCIPTATAENYFKAAKKRLASELKDAVRQHVARYCGEAGVENEFQAEWGRLSSFLQQHGGLEEIVRSAQHEFAIRRQSTRRLGVLSEVRRIEDDSASQEGRA